MAGESGIGYFGKIPALGDFVTRGLPTTFIETFDNWLQRGLFMSRETLGERWLAAYQAAPAWRFCLQSGVVDSSAWCGLMLPSFDRVGRPFPLTLLAVLPDGADLTTVVDGHSAWFDQVESAMWRIIRGETQAPAWDVEILNFVPPPLAARRVSEDTTVPLFQSPAKKSRYCVIHSHIDFVQILVHHMGVRGPRLAWWWLGHDRRTRFDCCLTEGLPESEQFAALLDQQWQLHGWAEKEFGTPAGAME
jgi:type VI secretion system protein ImpM